MPELCVVFDIDDTLYLESDYVRSGFEYVGRCAEKELGISNFAERGWSLFTAGHRTRIFDEIVKEWNIQEQQTAVAHLVGLYRSHRPQIRLLPDALQCLEALRGKARLAVISDGPREAQRNKVDALQLERWFDYIFLTDELGAGFGKPCPAAFQLVEEKFGCTGERCCYVADNPAKDFVAPRKLGWRTVRLRRNGGLYAELQADGDFAVDLELSDLSGLPDLLRQIWPPRYVPTEGPNPRQLR
jgi:putative hydrolase of the HAD superfamily